MEEKLIKEVEDLELETIDNEIIIKPGQIITLKNNEIKEVVQNNNSTEALSVNEIDPTRFKIQLQALNKIAKTIQEELEYGIDYWKIPGTQSDKPTLLKPGADKIALLYGLRIDYELVEKEVDKDNMIIKYHYKAIAYSMKSNMKVSEGEGICSSDEPAKKRQAKNPFEIENTIMKIARKRALVDAIIHIGNLSKVFTQDLDGMNANDNSRTVNNSKMSRNDMFGLYSTVYSIKVPNWDKMTKTEREEAKKYVKENNLLEQLIKRAGIENQTNMMNFTYADKEKLLNFLNEEKENEIVWAQDAN